METKRKRLLFSVSIYGGSLGVAGFLISLLARTKFPKEPEHLDFLPSVILSSSGLIVGAAIAGLFIYFFAPYADRPRNLFLWLIMGFAYGVLLPFFTGALIPLCTLILNLVLGIVSVSEIVQQLAIAVLRAPTFAFTNGTFGLFTGLLMGALFGFGAWGIDTTNSMVSQRFSRYGTIALATGLSIVVIVIAAYGPPEALSKLG